VKIFGWFRKQKALKPCPLCGGKIDGERPAILNYRVFDEDSGKKVLVEMQICNICADIFDASAMDGS
jgi:hypothetical protein